MAVTEEQIAFVRELFEDVGDLSTRKMMGGLAIYARGTVFALLHSEGTLWLKGAGAMAARLEAEGWTRWSYARGGKPVAMPYWRLPEAALDDPEMACALARDALDSL